jgi:alanine-synthesizing transaminase
MFSQRTPSDLAPNALTRAVARLREAAVPLVDLTESNPTRVGLEYPRGLLECLEHPRGLEYDPQPFGLPAARQAVAADYGRRGIAVDPARIVLTASSSESYSLLFKLLCDPGDRVLVPVPSYPLFDHLARLDAVDVRHYRLEHHGRWTVDADDLARLADDRTRALLAVSPNNPTGSMLTRGELADIQALCARLGVALVGDEVFADYPLRPGPHAARSVLEDPSTLTVSLGGLSKSAGLPQLKLGWMAFGGPDTLVREALARLELICDTYLSVGTPVQVSLSHLLEEGAHVRRQIADRVLLNYRVLAAEAARHPACRLLPAEGGWSAVVQAPAIASDEARALTLLHEAGVLVHPGHFFDFDRDGYFVLSLLVPPDDLLQAAPRMFEVLERA